MMQDEHIHESFLKETVFTVSPLNYMVYRSGYKACERADKLNIFIKRAEQGRDWN